MTKATALLLLAACETPSTTTAGCPGIMFEDSLTLSEDVSEASARVCTRSQVVDRDGLVPCEILETLPSGGVGACEGLPGREAEHVELVGERAVCRIVQLPSSDPPANTPGWHYEAGSMTAACPLGAFRWNGPIPLFAGARYRFRCYTELCGDAGAP